MGFSFDALATSFERLQHAHDLHGPHAALPATAPFLHAMSQVVALFDSLGSAFAFVKRDLDKKIGVIARTAAADPARYGDLTRALAHERAVVLPHAPATSVARTLLRLMWALRFADSLLGALAAAFDHRRSLPDDRRTLRYAVAAAYDDALAAHHSWAVRRSVKAACILLPSKEAFMARLELHEDDRAGVMERLGGSMSPLVTRMYRYYEKHDLLQLP